MKKYLRKLDGWPAAIIGVIVLCLVAFFSYQSYSKLEKENAQLLSELDLERESTYNLLQIIDEREAVIGSFKGQIDTLSGTVGTLTKLSQIDEELLAKYSKIYFLNENYLPKKLLPIADRYLNKEATNKEIHLQVWPYLERLLIDANSDGERLLVASAFRSFATQSALKSSYKVTYGTGANAFSADQGYSEHQLGTALDFTTEKLGSGFSAFGSDSAYEWLLKNAHRYGFVLSYPEGNAYYKFEPWHWRFVGVKLARRLKDDNMHFYDMDQREIDRHLVNLFD